MMNDVKMDGDRLKNVVTLAYANVAIVGANRDGRPITKVKKHGVRHVFWKRGLWHVRLEEWGPSPMINVELQGSERGKTVLTLLSGTCGGEDYVEDDVVKEVKKDVFIRAPKFQPVVVRVDGTRKEIALCIWESPDAETEEEARANLPPERARVGFHIIVNAIAGTTAEEKPDRA